MMERLAPRLAGGAAGLANGLFGGGGGMVFLPILSRWGGLPPRKLYATCVAVVSSQYAWCPLPSTGGGAAYPSWMHGRICWAVWPGAGWEESSTERSLPRR